MHAIASVLLIPQQNIANQESMYLCLIYVHYERKYVSLHNKYIFKVQDYKVMNFDIYK